MPPRKILSIGHSYIVDVNRRLAQSMAAIGQPDWDILTVCPQRLPMDFRQLVFEPGPEEGLQTLALPVYLHQKIHFMLYDRRLKDLLDQAWDIVHGWQEPFTLTGGQIAAWTPPSSALIFFSDQNQSKHYPFPFNWVETFTMGRASGWIAPGQTGLMALQDRPGYAPLPRRVIPHGVDLEIFHPDAAARQWVLDQLDWGTQPEITLGYLGRLVPEKGLAFLMGVLDQLEVPWKALFVGRGPLEADLRQWAERYPQTVRVCTTVHHHQVPAYLNAMDILLAPSQTTRRWVEQFGRMSVEAFACGIPVVGSDSGEIPYVLEGAGLVVPEDSPTDWVQTLAALMDSPDQRKALSARGLAKARQHYAWPVVAQAHLDFFQAILEGEA